MLEKKSIWSCQQNLEVHCHAFDGGWAGSAVELWANQGLVLLVPLEGGENQQQKTSVAEDITSGSERWRIAAAATRR